MPSLFSSRPFRLLGHLLPALLVIALLNVGAVRAAPVIVGPAPPTLSSVSVSPASVVGGTSATGTVTVAALLSGTATVALTSSSPAVSVPELVTVSAGKSAAAVSPGVSARPSSTSFVITTTAVPAPTTATITATSGGVVVTTTLVLTPAAPILTSIVVSPASATLTTGGTQTFTAVAKDQNGTTLATQPPFTWTVTGVGTITSAGVYSAGSTAGTATVKAASGTVSATAAVTVNVASARLMITNISNGSVLSGDVDVTTFIAGSSPGFGDVSLYIDGVEIESGQPDPDGQGNNTVVITVPSNEYANGTHQIKVMDAQGNTDIRTVIFSNVISSLRYNPVMDTNGSASDVPHTAQITATLSSSQQWQIQIQDDSDNVIKSFSGSGTSINVSWNGTNSSGLVVSDDSYDFTITTTPTGSAAPASATSQGANTTNSVTRPIAKDSIGDTLILMDVKALAAGTIGKREALLKVPPSTT